MSQPVMVVDGLVKHGPDGARLIGSRCAGCDTLYFPQRPICANPACHNKDVRVTLLPDRGTLYSYTIQRYQPPPPCRIDGWKPYMLGLIDLGGGVRVMGMLTDVEQAAVQIGMPLKLVTETLFTDAGRGAVATYKFAPVDEGVA